VNWLAYWNCVSAIGAHAPISYGCSANTAGPVLWGPVHCMRCGIILEPIDLYGRPIRSAVG
jgi:hypothetical protein